MVYTSLIIDENVFFVQKLMIFSVSIIRHRGKVALRITSKNMTNNATGKNCISKKLSLQIFLIYASQLWRTSSTTRFQKKSLPQYTDRETLPKEEIAQTKNIVFSISHPTSIKRRKCFNHQKSQHTRRISNIQLSSLAC